MNKLCYFLIYLCGLYWQGLAQGFWFHDPERTLEWQHGTLASKILNNLADSHSHENVVFSPLSVHTAMTLLYLGAQGETAQELYRVLLPSSSNRAIIVHEYNELVNSTFNRKISDFDLRMASALVVNENYQIPDSFYPLAYKLGTYVVPANFSDGDKIVRSINTLVERITHSKIKSILEQGSVDDRKVAVLVNALYLKALWQSPFSKMSTTRQYFHLDNNRRIEVDMMSNDDEYRWAKISKLNAIVLELPYKNTDLTMLIVLPDEGYGLKNLEKKIREESIDWNDISDSLHWDYVNLGVSRVFSDFGNLSGLFVNSGPVGVKKIQHKAYLKVNEAGTEGAAATVGILSNRMLFRTISIDRPFVFVIRNRNAVYFIGHVAKP